MAKTNKNKKDKEEKLESIEPRKDQIVVREIASEMKDCYLDYSMSVIVSRALPDVRDGLKPVHRRILYTMHEAGLTQGAKFRKSASIVGDALGRYHPHGDASVYDAMARMAQDFSMRYPLVDGQGNWGSIDGDNQAAMRYTEARMKALSSEILRDIEKDTVIFRPNYDNRLQEPSVLPAVFPQLLANGVSGIAVGMATSIPPHNLSEVIDATTYLIENPKCSIEDLLVFVKGPDFPTGGIIYNNADIAHAYASGRGGVVTRGEAEITENSRGTAQIVITSIPYQVNKSEMIIKMADLVQEKKVEGIKDIRDESSREGLRVAIDLKQGINPQKILNTLYKHTDLEKTFHFNMIALVNGIQPKLLSLKEILEYFILHRQDVVVRRTKFDLNKALDREHILEGLKKAIDFIDAVIKTIRASKDKEEAFKNLIAKFKFSEKQTEAILEMRLQTLAGLERKKIEDELEEKKKLIKELKALLADPKKILKVIKDELIAIKDKYGDERRTRVAGHAVKQISTEDLVPEKEAVLVLTQDGYVKITDPESYKSQKRGGVGVIDMNTKEEDVVNIFLTANTHDDLLFFTDKGKAYQIKMYELPEGKKATKGKSIFNYLSLSDDEKITSILAVPKAKKKEQFSLIMITKQGIIKKADADSFKTVRKNGIAAMKLQKGDELKYAGIVNKGESIILITSGGQAVRFKESDLRVMGRGAGGVRGMKLKKSDEVIGADIIDGDTGDKFLLTMSKNGFGKKSVIKDYKIQKRGGSGIKTSKITSKTGPLMIGKVVGPEHEELIAVSQKGQVIKTSLSDIPKLGRQTQGVRIMKLREGDHIASLTCL